MKKRGISLMVLVITIVVIVIISSAVVMTFTNSNTLGNSNVSTFVSNKESYQQALKLYINDATVKTFSNYSVEELLLGTGDERSYYIVENTTGRTIQINSKTITVYKLDEQLFKDRVGVEINTSLPNDNWYVSSTGQIFYVFTASQNMPTWVYKDGKVNDNLSSFVSDNLT